MRQIVPYIFWPWFATSCVILLRRRVTSGTWRALPADDPVTEPSFPAPPAAALADPVALTDTDDAPATPPRPTTTANTTTTITAARSLAEALEGIAMPCDLTPLIGTGSMHPRQVDFFTSGHAASTVGAALADEFERLGYEITPLDDQSIRAERGPDVIRARLVSAALTSEAVMTELHPSAPAGSLVVELHLA